MNPINQERSFADGARDVAGGVADYLQGNPAPCFKLIVECWEIILDHLSLDDLLALGQTCKLMQQLTGCYIREQFPECNGRWNYDEYAPGRFQIQGSNASSNFIPFVRELEFHRDMDYAHAATAEFSTIKPIFHITNTQTINNTVDARSVLKNAETIKVWFVKENGQFFEQLADFCPNLKDLSVISNSATSNQLFSHHFPSLENLKHKSGVRNSTTANGDLESFLQNHSKLKHFETDDGFLWANRDVITQTNVQLDSLGIHFGDSPPPLDQFTNWLKILRTRGFYKTLHLSFRSSPFQNNINFDTTLPTIESLHGCFDVSRYFDLSQFANLRDLHTVLNDWTQIDMELLAKNLVNLEHLYPIHPSDCISPFVCYSPRLKTIRTFGENDISDLFELNENRKKLVNACQVTIIVREDVYLRSKWKSKVSYFSHVKMARIGLESCARNRLFLAPIRDSRDFL